MNVEGCRTTILSLFHGSESHPAYLYRMISFDDVAIGNYLWCFHKVLIHIDIIKIKII